MLVRRPSFQGLRQMKFAAHKHTTHTLSKHTTHTLSKHTQHTTHIRAHSLCDSVPLSFSHTLVHARTTVPEHTVTHFSLSLSLPSLCLSVSLSSCTAHVLLVHQDTVSHSLIHLQHNNNVYHPWRTRCGMAYEHTNCSGLQYGYHVWISVV